MKTRDEKDIKNIAKSTSKGIQAKDVLIKPDEDLLDPKDDAVFKFLFASENVKIPAEL